MLTIKEILAIKDPEERQRALHERKRQQAEEERNDPMREVKQALRARMAGCPQFLSFAILPIPNFLQGKVPVDVISERTLNALRVIDFAKPEVKEILAESYSQEVEFVRDIIRAFGVKDLQELTQLELFRQEVRTALESYMAKPEMKREHFLL